MYRCLQGNSDFGVCSEAICGFVRGLKEKQKGEASLCAVFHLPRKLQFGIGNYCTLSSPDNKGGKAKMDTFLRQATTHYSLWTTATQQHFYR